MVVGAKSAFAMAREKTAALKAPDADVLTAQSVVLVMVVYAKAGKAEMSAVLPVGVARVGVVGSVARMPSAKPSAVAIVFVMIRTAIAPEFVAVAPPVLRAIRAVLFVLGSEVGPVPVSMLAGAFGKSTVTGLPRLLAGVRPMVSGDVPMAAFDGVYMPVEAIGVATETLGLL